MKNSKNSTKVEIFQAQPCDNQLSGVSNKYASILKVLCDQNTEVKDSVEKLGVVLEYFAGTISLDEAALADYVKNFPQEDVFLLTYVADANKCLREILYTIEEDIEGKIN